MTEGGERPEGIGGDHGPAGRYRPSGATARSVAAVVAEASDRHEPAPRSVPAIDHRMPIGDLVRRDCAGEDHPLSAELMHRPHPLRSTTAGGQDVARRWS